MHNVYIAEWILALVTNGERAASTVGDLTEQAATRGEAWFWSSVLRTAASLLCYDIVQNPVRVTALAFLGLVIYIEIEVLHAGLTGLAFFYQPAATGHLDSFGWKLWFAAPALVSSLLIGRMLARLAPRRELAACAVYLIFASIYNLIPMFGDNGIFAALLCLLFVPAGTLWGRSRKQSTTRPA